MHLLQEYLPQLLQLLSPLHQVLSLLSTTPQAPLVQPNQQNHARERKSGKWSKIMSSLYKTGESAKSFSSRTESNECEDVKIIWLCFMTQLI